jgi:hypothetical protein
VERGVRRVPRFAPSTPPAGAGHHRASEAGVRALAAQLPPPSEKEVHALAHERARRVVRVPLAPMATGSAVVIVG